MKVYVVCWACASQDDNGNCLANGGVHGVYTDREKARVGLIECKEETYNEIVYNPDFDEEEIQERKNSTQVYGSSDQDYFEIDYESWDIPNEIRIEIIESEVE